MQKLTFGHRLCCLTLVTLVAAVSACSDEEAIKDPIADLVATQTFDVDDAPGAVRILTDSNGVRHIYGDGEAATIWGQGYAAARDRLWQMDVLRRFSNGRLAALFGTLALEVDYERRAAFLNREGEPIENVLAAKLHADHPDIYALAEAYRDGINAYMEDIKAGRNGAAMPVEYDYFLVNLDPEELTPWTVEDTLAIGRLQSWELSASGQWEVELYDWFLALGEDKFADTMRFQPPSNATTLGGKRGSAPAWRPTAVPPTDSAPVVDENTRSLVRQQARRPLKEFVSAFEAPRDTIGSNNWIVAPAQSANGHAMLANDPHLGLSNPAIWHVVHMNPNYITDKGLPAAQGVSFPGIPGIILGYNDYVAWGGTVAGYDVADVYLETLDTSGTVPTVLFKGKQVSVLRKSFTFEVRNGSSVTYDIDIVPHHGPMMPDPDYDDDVEGIEASGMSMRWTGHEASVDAAFIVNMMRATSVEEGKEALRLFAVGAQNWVMADVHGDIAYFPYAWVPQRPAGVLPWFPMSGEGDAEWLTNPDGTPKWLPEASLPQAMNPAKGYLATANTDLQGNLQDNDPINDDIYLYWDRADGYRLERILDLLDDKDGSRGGKISLQDMGDYQYDHYVKEAEYLLPLILKVASDNHSDLSAAAKDAIQRLQNWLDDDVTPLNAHAGRDVADNRDDLGEAVEVSQNDKDDAIATTIFYAVLSRLQSHTFGDELDDAEITDSDALYSTRGLLHILQAEADGAPERLAYVTGTTSRFWDDTATTDVTETKGQIVVRAIEDALDDMKAWFDTDNQADWLWGDMHVLVLEHNFGSADASNAYNFGEAHDIPRPGARKTVSPAGFGLGGPLAEPDEYIVSSWGASKRFIIEMNPDTGPVGYNIVPGGQVGGRTDTADYDTAEGQYQQWTADWLRGNRFQYLFQAEDVAGDALEVWDLE